MNYILEDKMTGLRAVSLAVLLYIVGYAIKITVLLNNVLLPVISNELMRYTASVFTSVALSTGLLIVSVNEINKYTPYIISMMDAVMLLLVFNIFTATSFYEAFTLIFISLFMAFIGYQLINVFVIKHKRLKADKQQAISEINNEYSKSLQELNDLNQKLSEAKQTTCQYCEKEYQSVNALNAHKGKCKKNPKNL
ncbi:hypothetical protein [Tenacibaculum soleae]|uniref:hypothetical protein n=1 Tax=Tenacibaculum soleae TaxID=447689 RepID=UPI0022FFDF37|nr:hypothetical protein [Tenacibaculum soleae]